MKLKVELVTAILFLMICSGCSSCKSTPRITYPLGTEIKNYTLFKQNSYWVYQLEGGSTIDSVHLFQQDYGVASPGQLDYNYENFVTQSRSSYLNEIVVQSGIAASPAFYDSDFLKFAYAGTLGTDIVAYFSRKSKGYKFALFPAIETEYKDSLASITLGSVTYNNVKVFQVTSAIPSDVRLPKVIYLAPNIGIVRKELFNGQIWNLVRRQVTQ